jgi:hypothetical protein
MTGEDQSSSDQVAEILLAMFGEKCSYLKSDVMGLVFSFQSVSVPSNKLLLATGTSCMCTN